MLGRDVMFRLALQWCWVGWWQAVGN